MGDIPHFRDSIYRNLDISRTLEFFGRRFVAPLNDEVPVGGRTAVDVACGYGWLAAAFVMAGGRLAIAVDSDIGRLRAAQKISQLLGVENRVIFVNAGIEALPLCDESSDFVMSIETLEHVGAPKIGPSVEEISRVAKRAIIVTTPNGWFPVVAHDTRIPFLHWLPPGRRGRIARAFGRLAFDEGNVFLTPTDLAPLAREFARVSTCYTFRSFIGYRAHYPVYMPYGPDEARRWRRRPGVAKGLFYRMAAALLRTSSFRIMPTLAGLFVRRGSEDARSNLDEV